MEHRVDFEHVADREGVIAYWLSVSSIAWLPDDERTTLADELRSLLLDVVYRLPCRAETHVTRRFY